MIFYWSFSDILHQSLEEDVNITKIYFTPKSVTVWGSRACVCFQFMCDSLSRHVSDVREGKFSDFFRFCFGNVIHTTVQIYDHCIEIFVFVRTVKNPSVFDHVGFADVHSSSGADSDHEQQMQTHTHTHTHELQFQSEGRDCV